MLRQGSEHDGARIRVEALAVCPARPCRDRTPLARSLPSPVRTRANAKEFTGSTWIVQKGDRDAILGPRPAGTRVPDPKFFEGFANSKTVLLHGEDHDVFGDGTVTPAGLNARSPRHFMTEQSSAG
jgi:hypothetical protein